MNKLNPYASPAAVKGSNPDSPDLFNRRRQKVTANIILGATVFGAITYTLVDESIARTSFGAWPMLIGSAVIAAISAIVTRRPLTSPMTCFLATVSGDLVAAMLRGWQYAQVEYCIPLAIGFSIPALMLALLLRKWRGDLP